MGNRAVQLGRKPQTTVRNSTMSVVCGACFTDSSRRRSCAGFCHSDSGEVEVTPGLYTPTGPRCIIRMMDGLRTGRCLDGESLDAQPGGPVHVYPCTKQWNQFLSFGNGVEAPKMAIHTNVPLHTRRRIAETGREQEPYMCLGVPGRGKLDEEDWLGVRTLEEEEYEESSDDEESDLEGKIDEIDRDKFSLDDDGEASEHVEIDVDGLPSLLEWEGQQLIATRCSNAGAVIEWVVVPFIVEDLPAPENDRKGETDKEAQEL